MPDQEEKLFNGLKEQYKDLPIPEDIDLYIKRGISKANNKSKIKRRFMISIITASMLLFILVGSIRVSPSFAMYLNNIPGFSKVVEFIYNDKGLKSAIDHGFVQSVGESGKYDDVTVTIDQVIVDEEKMVLFYTVENIKHYNRVYAHTQLNTLDNQKYAYGNGSVLDFNTGIDNSVSGKVEFYLKDNIPDDFIFKVDLDTTGWNKNVYGFSDTISIEFSVDKNLFEYDKKLIAIHETVEIEGQRITFDSIFIYPTRTELKLTFDKNNTKKISGFNDLRISDNKDNEWFPIESDNSPYLFKESEAIVYLESSYFEDPEEMYVAFSSVRAVNKDKVDLVIDLDKRALISAPDDHISLFMIGEYESDFYNSKIKKYLSLVFLMRDEHQRDLLEIDSDFTDGMQNEYQIQGYTYRKGAKTKEIHIPQQEYMNPIKLRIVDYPTTIYKDVVIKIK
ncbi:DUF4179 domain-containing protein [Chengkuizengella axinellae]|uniref:DUF4179 domain-containing protein n=1 Tax=Chengkuizengella axinellae TaxID=3064388 RepID=A0ABT9J1T3_9BACL|nr:DUF4179 domain-containing protein [Chengkuizengella sp. 2205SS18-9]MDP5275575.1 DUF4179 domain-containing protein [Chengkuizengella sp. 2205SS18-9]